MEMTMDNLTEGPVLAPEEDNREQEHSGSVIKHTWS